MPGTRFQPVTHVLPEREQLPRGLGYHPRIGPGDPSSSPAVSRLRGAGVSVDAASVVRTISTVLLVGLTTSVVLLFLSGYRQNHTRQELSDRGAPVMATVDSCLGLLGGSGSNAAGYSCRASFLFQGRIFTESIPGTRLRPRGEAVKLVVDPLEPSALALADHVPAPSAGVYVLPGVLLGPEVVSAAALVQLRRRRSRSA
jgi:hypothetical protein